MEDWAKSKIHPDAEPAAFVEFSQAYSTFPEKDTEPILHIYQKIRNSKDLEWEDAEDDIQLSLVDNKVCGKSLSEWEDVDEEDLQVYDEFLRSPCKNEPSITNWEFFCKDWNENSPIKVEFPDKQPDYTNIKED